MVLYVHTSGFTGVCPIELRVTYVPLPVDYSRLREEDTSGFKPPVPPPPLFHSSHLPLQASLAPIIQEEKVNINWVCVWPRTDTCVALIPWIIVSRHSCPLRITAGDRVISFVRGGTFTPHSGDACVTCLVVFMVTHPRGSYMLSLEEATPENRSTH